MRRIEDLLAFHFGAGLTMAVRGSATIAQLESSLVGDGNTPSTPKGPNEQAMVKFGHVNRALRRISPTYQHALAVGYGDTGHAATDDGKHLSRRWLAVAPLTEEAQRRGRAWRAERNDPNDHGNPGYQWWHHILAKGTDQLGQKAVEKQARALLQAALAVFEGALLSIEEDQRAIKRTALAREAPRAQRLPMAMAA
jgi:hypothetical protein